MARSRTTFTKKTARRAGKKGARVRWSKTTPGQRRDHALKMLAARYGRFVMTGKA